MASQPRSGVSRSGPGRCPAAHLHVPVPQPCCRLCLAKADDSGRSQGKAHGGGTRPDPALCPHHLADLAARPPPDRAGQQLRRPARHKHVTGTAHARCCCSLPRYRSHGQERQGGEFKVPKAASFHLGQAQSGRRSPPACLVGAERGTSWNKDLFQSTGLFQLPGNRKRPGPRTVTLTHPA